MNKRKELFPEEEAVSKVERLFEEWKTYSDSDKLIGRLSEEAITLHKRWSDDIGDYKVETADAQLRSKLLLENFDKLIEDGADSKDVIMLMRPFDVLMNYQKFSPYLKEVLDPDFVRVAFLNMSKEQIRGVLDNGLNPRIAAASVVDYAEKGYIRYFTYLDGKVYDNVYNSLERRGSDIVNIIIDFGYDPKNIFNILCMNMSRSRRTPGFAEDLLSELYVRRIIKGSLNGVGPYYFSKAVFGNMSHVKTELIEEALKKGEDARQKIAKAIIHDARRYGSVAERVRFVDRVRRKHKCLHLTDFEVFQAIIGWDEGNELRLSSVIPTQINVTKCDHIAKAIAENNLYRKTFVKACIYDCHRSTQVLNRKKYVETIKAKYPDLHLTELEAEIMVLA